MVSDTNSSPMGSASYVSGVKWVVMAITAGFYHRRIPRLAAGVVGDRQPQCAGGGVIVEVVAGALELRRRHQQGEHRRPVRRPLTFLRLVAPDDALHGGQNRAVSGELAAIDRSLLLE